MTSSARARRYAAAIAGSRSRQVVPEDRQVQQAAVARTVDVAASVGDLERVADSAVVVADCCVVLDENVRTDIRAGAVRIDIRLDLDCRAAVATALTHRTDIADGGRGGCRWELFSLLTVCQLVIDVAGELSARRGERFEDYTEAVRNLARDPRFDPELVRQLERLPGFLNVLVHDYVALDLDRVVEALDELDPIERFLDAARRVVDSR